MGVASTADTNNGAPVASAAKATSSLSPLLKGLVGASSFVRHNPKSDRFKVVRFHHIDFWCMDATSTYKR